MRKRFHKTFEELVNENRAQLLNDPEAIHQIEKKVEDKHALEKQDSK
ncbi:MULTISPECIES: FbpB family small basic protein [Alteribacter]|uniref:FbpB family small basic protein n=1 Tax=Alteribacter keqinensis TaxID=2483800 RepID=A0A3M7TPI5_9BACI|nr:MULTISPECIES: FbpB family small basic protein [Alteribacter]MBM7095312.1 FbpB family small basic protein [Alteribacter salitolerans]RNA67056.1 FbpB family small basic protein [Alteribacter keqinensis]